MYHQANSEKIPSRYEPTKYTLYGEGVASSNLAIHLSDESGFR